jgi:predicted unusual protein kinase regulating ubiquinone biosynthesis (AarF/ABC1/UbiB family)
MKAIMNELEERFLDECDYRKEADYQEAYAAQLAGHPDMLVPAVHRSRSGRRVLTTTLMEGRSFYEWIADDPSVEARNRATRLFYRFYIGSLYLHGLFNCDPHPGNYLFRDDGKVVFLDYGCCRRFPAERLSLWKGMCLAVAHDDAEAMKRLAVQIGFYGDRDRVDWPSFHALMRYLYQPYLEDAPFDFALHPPGTTFRHMFTANPNLFRLNMPADAVFLNRIGFGLVSLLARIGATMNCRRVITEYFDGVDPHWRQMA